MSEAVWITWEDHRRSRELASALGVPLIVENSPFPQGFSHLTKASNLFFQSTQEGQGEFLLKILPSF